ncbi:MAG: OmpA family protein [Cyanobacteria bacterium SZAS LIN-5]|nr:OmpA family protein [Cyanobacteria bacterium SZAS LIN-5]
MKPHWKMIILPLACLASTNSVCHALIEKQEPAVNVIKGTVAAIGYHMGANTRIDLNGSRHATQASGEARVSARPKGTEIDLRVSDLRPPSTLGGQFLTYVAWTVTPDGTTKNLGEIQINQNGSGRLEARTLSPTFALIVTAEPYFAVRMPSELVVLKNVTNNRTRGQIFPNNSYKLMKVSEYSRSGNPLSLIPDLKKAPLEVYQARNAIEIARLRGAEQRSQRIFAEANAALQRMENSLKQNSGRNQLISDARQTIQLAEDARALAVQHEELERIESEKQAAAAAAAAKAKAEADRRAAVEARHQAELAAAREAQIAAVAAAHAAEQRAQAQAAAAAAAAEQAALQAKADAAKEEAARAHAATIALRAQLLQQLNSVLQTTDTPRGLVVQMADVLFDIGKFTLSKDAQLKLARLSGIILAHPGLNLTIEGHTDNTGSDALNMTLSDQRASTVRQFLISQGLSANAISSKGFGLSKPIADNSTAEGRRQNRRVEIIVSGQAIGADIAK